MSSTAIPPEGMYEMPQLDLILSIHLILTLFFFVTFHFEYMNLQ